MTERFLLCLRAPAFYTAKTQRRHCLIAALLVARTEPRPLVSA